MIVVEYSRILGMRIFTGFKVPNKQNWIDHRSAYYLLRQTSRRIKDKIKK